MRGERSTRYPVTPVTRARTLGAYMPSMKAKYLFSLVVVTVMYFTLAILIAPQTVSA